MPLRSHHPVKESTPQRGPYRILDALSYGKMVFLSSVARSKELIWPWVGKPRPYATSFPTDFPSSSSLVQRLQELDKMQSNGISQACLERMQRLHLLHYHHNWTPCSLSCLSQETFTEQMTSRHIQPTAAQRGSHRKCLGFYARMAGSEFFAVKIRREEWTLGDFIYFFLIYWLLRGVS